MCVDLRQLTAYDHQSGHIAAGLPTVYLENHVLLAVGIRFSIDGKRLLDEMLESPESRWADDVRTAMMRAALGKAYLGRQRCRRYASNIG